MGPNYVPSIEIHRLEKNPAKKDIQHTLQDSVITNTDRWADISEQGNAQILPNHFVKYVIYEQIIYKILAHL